MHTFMLFFEGLLALSTVSMLVCAYLARGEAHETSAEHRRVVALSEGE